MFYEVIAAFSIIAVIICAVCVLGAFAEDEEDTFRKSLLCLFLFLIYPSLYIYGRCNATVVNSVNTPILSYTVKDKVYQLTYKPSEPQCVITLSTYRDSKEYGWNLNQHGIFNYQFYTAKD